MKKLARMLIADADADDKDSKDADANADVDADDEDWMLMLTTKIGRMLMTVSYFASSRLPRILPGTRSAPSHTHHFLSGTRMKTVMMRVMMRVMMVMRVTMMMTHSQCPITHSPFPEQDNDDDDCYDDEGDDGDDDDCYDYEGDDGDDDDALANIRELQ